MNVLKTESPELIEQLTVGPAWSGHKVNYSLLTTEVRQYVGYYGADRQLVIASHLLDSRRWDYHRLDTAVGWDSHNTVQMFCDRSGCLHIAANMHAVPLIYFRMERPHDPASLVRIPSLIGDCEEKCTYPRFLSAPDGRMIFHYRNGFSGCGNEIYDVYDADSRTWSRLLEQPLTSGCGRMNAYFFGPVSGPDGFYHLAWVWRDTGDCSTNHDLCYARSRDLRHWENVEGQPLSLPMTSESPGITVLSTPPRNSGLINMCGNIGFDASGVPVLSFHLYNESGASRIYTLRLRPGGEHQLVPHGTWSENERWEFSGGGSIRQMVFCSPVRPQADGTLLLDYEFIGRSAGCWRLDPETLKTVETLAPRFACPAELRKMEQGFPGLIRNWLPDAGKSEEKGTQWFLRWESLPANRDRPHAPPLPEPTRLSVCKVRFPGGCKR